jgi:hypothetical protein
MSSTKVLASEVDHGRSATAWTAGVVGWLIPGAGHIFLGRWVRGGVIGLGVFVMFGLGFVFGGHLFSLSGPESQSTTFLLRIPPIIANVGTGIIYFICWLFGAGFESKAALPTSEYGNTFLWVAGLLNYLAALDAFDIGIGRKK